MRQPHKKLKIILLSLLGLIVVATLYLFCYEAPYSGLIKSGDDEVLIFAHRGFGIYAPDNSLVAGKLALAQGIDGIDVDGQQTIDKELVIFHDLSLERLTSSTGRVSEKTLAELRALDLAPKFKAGTKGALVASFEDFVVAAKDKGLLMVELKVPGAGATGVEEETVRIIQKHQAHEYVYLSSFNPVVLYRLKKIDSQIRTVFIFMDTNWNAELRAEIKEGDLVDLPWIVRQEFIRTAIRKFIKPDLLSVNHEVDEATIDKLLELGYPIFLWAPDTEKTVKHALGKKPYSIISDDPLLAKQLRDEKADD